MDQVVGRQSLPDSPRTFGFFVDGKQMEAGERAYFERRSPGHDVPVTRIPKCTREDLDLAVKVARRAFEDGRWSRIPAVERANVLLRAAQILRSRAAELAYWETLENGKPISQARAEVDGCAGMFEYAAGLGSFQFEGRRVVASQKADVGRDEHMIVPANDADRWRVIV